MSIKSKVLTAGAVIALAAGTGAALTGTAQASTAGCAFTNGCATLHGVTVNGSAVAMDAKHQNKNEILIGYPDNVGDGATSFDADLHYGKGSKTTSYADTGLQFGPNFASVPCITGTPHNSDPVPAAGTLTSGTGEALTVEATTGTVTVTPSSGTVLTVNGGSAGGTFEVDQEYASDGNSCVAAYNYSVASGSTPIPAKSPASPDLATLNWPTSPGDSQFTFLESDSGGTFSFTGLPAGISVNGGTLTADTSTAHPGTYTNVGVTYTATDGAVWTATFTLTVSAIKSVTPGAGVAFYTFVYAPNGNWTSQCVTDINGSGALKLFPCTLGKDTGQDFTVDSSNGLLGSGQAHVSNILAQATSASSCLTDPSTSAPGTPQSDAADELPPGGRQLYVNGSCAANTNLWSWGT
jgi:hypothetical protein